MAYIILRAGKLKTNGNIAGVGAHLQRTRDTPNADPELTHQNEILRGSADLLADVNGRLDEVKAVHGKLRTNAVLAIEHLITFSPDFVQFSKEKQEPGGDITAKLVPKSEVDSDRLVGFVARTMAWLDERYGRENVVNVQLHMDESTPHIHAVVVPVDERGKLNCRAFLGGPKLLREMQTSIAEEMAPLGLVRGVKGSQADHQAVQRFYTLANELEPGLANEVVQARLQAGEKDRQKDPNPPLSALIHYHDEQVGNNILEDLRAVGVRVLEKNDVQKTIKVEYSMEDGKIDKIHELFGGIKIGNNHIEESGADFRERGSRAMELVLAREQGLSIGE